MTQTSQPKPPAVAPTMEWAGASGTKYTYSIYPIGQRFSPGQPGNYIFTARKKKVDGNGFVHTPIYMGESAEGLQERFDGHEKRACIERHGATHVLVHLNRDRETRESEETDLIRKWNPPCNLQ